MMRSAPRWTLFLALCLASARPDAAAGENPFTERLQRAEPTAQAVAEAARKLAAYAPVEPVDALPLAPFHARAATPQPPRPSLCRHCHLATPHREAPEVRTFLNAHTRYIACETCHFRPTDSRLEHRWLDFASAGDQAQTGPLADGERPAQWRIAPFRDGARALLFGDEPVARRLARDWERGTNTQRAALLARLHTVLEPDGPGCGACHGERDTLLDYTALGFSAERAGAMANNDIARYVERVRDSGQAVRLRNLLPAP